MAFTVILGIHVALRSDNSRFAAINTLGTVFFLSVGTLVCIYLISITGIRISMLQLRGLHRAGIGGLWWVLSAERPSAALNLASALLPIAVFYTITNIIIGKPATGESTDPLIPLIVTGGAFGFAVAAMAVPLMSEFDVAIGRQSAIGESIPPRGLALRGVARAPQSVRGFVNVPECSRRSRPRSSLIRTLPQPYATELLTAAVAHFGVFSRLAQQPMTLTDLGAALGLAERPANVLVDGVASHAIADHA